MTHVQHFDWYFKEIIKLCLKNASKDLRLDVRSNFFLLLFLISESPAGSTAPGKVEKHSFEFDHVFSKDAQQEVVFEEISQLVQVSQVAVFV